MLRPRPLESSPLIIRFDSKQNILRPNAELLAGVSRLQAPAVASDELTRLPYSNEQWRGCIAVASSHTLAQTLAGMLPEALCQLPEGKVLRDKRNRVWNVELAHGGTVTIKLNRARGIKKFTYRFFASKGKRHWDTAVAMTQLGIATPRPPGLF